jgi:hypothetical protein
MIRPKVEKIIMQVLETIPKGSILFNDDFQEYGNNESVKKALIRLQEKGILVRLARGIYLLPKIDKELGILYPSTEEIAKAIARRDKARIYPTGVIALNKIGISPQVPMKFVYLTDGATRTVYVGKRTIMFRKTSPKNLLLKGKISGLVIQALKTIRQHNVDDQIIEIIKSNLIKEKKENILHDARLSPAWIKEILLQTL